MTFSELERDYRRYRAIVDEHERQPANVTVDRMVDLDDVFVQEALWKRDGESFSTAVDRSVIATALDTLSKTVSTSRSDLSKLLKRLFDELQVSRTASV